MKYLILVVLLVGLTSGCASNKAQQQAQAQVNAEANNGDPRDPFEGFNRTMWDFNYDILDKYYSSLSPKVMWL